MLQHYTKYFFYLFIIFFLSSCIESVNPVNVKISLVKPSKIILTKGVIEVEILIEGDKPDKVEVLINDVAVAEMEQPYKFTIDLRKIALEDNSSLPDGDHVLKVRATLNGESVDSSEQKIILDTTPPQLLRLPKQGKRSLNEPLLFKFTEPILESSISDDSITVISEKGQEFSPSFWFNTISGEHILAVFFQFHPTPINEMVTVTLSPGNFTDLVGNKMEAQAAEVTVKYAEWLALDQGEHYNEISQAYITDLAANARGDLAAAWQQGDELRISRWLNGEWQAVGKVIDQTDNYALAISGVGKPFVVYARDSDNKIIVRVWDGISWTQLGDALNITEKSRIGKLQISLSERDALPVVVWTEGHEGNKNLYAKRWNGLHWQQIGSALDIDLSEDVSEPSLSLDHSGNAYVVWLEGKAVHLKVETEQGWQLSDSWSKDAHPDSNIFSPHLAISQFAEPTEQVLSIVWTERVPVENDPGYPNYELVAQQKAIRDSEWNQLERIRYTSSDVSQLKVQSLVLDDIGKPYLILSAFGSSGEFTDIRRWDLDQWRLIRDLDCNLQACAATGVLTIDAENALYMAFSSTGLAGDFSAIEVCK